MLGGSSYENPKYKDDWESHNKLIGDVESIPNY